MFLKQVYRYGDDQKLHIRRLAPRRPSSITQIQVANDGGLEYIRQYPTANNWIDLDIRATTNFDVSPLGGLQSPLIPVDRLIAHVNEKEGGDWYGRSLLGVTPAG